MAQPLPRFYAHTTKHQDAQRITRIVNEGGMATTPTPSASTGKLVGHRSGEGDPMRLRGIPVVGGVSGTSPGTDPYQATQRKLMPRGQR